MNLTAEPEIVNFPETHYVFVEKHGDFHSIAPQAWKSVHEFVPEISKKNRITGGLSLYKIGPKMYRAGFALAEAPVHVPDGLAYEKFGGGKYAKFVHTGPYSQLPEASGRGLEDCGGKEADGSRRLRHRELPERSEGHAGRSAHYGNSGTDGLRAVGRPQPRSNEFRRSFMSIANAQNVVVERPAGSAASTAKWQLWTGRVLAALAVLFLLFDAAGKFMMPVQVVQASQRLGFPVSLSPTLGVLLTISTLLYAIPRTAVLGAVLLTGYLGGAVAIHMRAGSTLFEMVFPVILGILVWGGIYLRDARLRRVFPIR